MLQISFQEGGGAVGGWEGEPGRPLWRHQRRGQRQYGELININNVTIIAVSFQVLVDFLQELLHPSTEVRGLHDSGAYQVRILDFRENLSQDILPYNPDYYPFGDQCRE